MKKAVNFYVENELCLSRFLKYAFEVNLNNFFNFQFFSLRLRKMERPELKYFVEFSNFLIIRYLW